MTSPTIMERSAPNKGRLVAMAATRIALFPDRLDDRNYHRFGHRIEWRRNREHETMVLRIKMQMEDAA